MAVFFAVVIGVISVFAFIVSGDQCEDRWKDAGVSYKMTTFSGCMIKNDQDFWVSDKNVKKED